MLVSVKLLFCVRGNVLRHEHSSVLIACVWSVCVCVLD